jgi:hypothetical protein
LVFCRCCCINRTSLSYRATECVTTTWCILCGCCVFGFYAVFYGSPWYSLRLYGTLYGRWIPWLSCCSPSVMNRKQRSQNRIPIVPFRTPPASSESSATEIIMKKKGGDFNECMQAKTDLNENNQDLRVAAYTATLTTMGHGWTNSTMTETGLSQLHHECQKLDGRLTVVDTAVVKCNHDSDDATWSAYTNVGDCFPNIPAGEPYTVASFFTNMSTSSSDLGSIFGMIMHPKRMPTQSSNSSCCRRRCVFPRRRLFPSRTAYTLSS